MAKKKAVCVKCGREWPYSLIEKWGEAPESDGYGPNPVCVNLTKDRLGSNQVCRGELRVELG